jgi:cell division protein FtsZ
MPVPRRPMSAPLRQTVTVEETRAAPLELETPVEQPRPVEAAPAPAAEAAQAPAALEEPSLFEEMNVQQAAEQDQSGDVFEEPEQMGDDGLPPPAYQPQVPEFRPQADVAGQQADAFVAPKAPAPGTPSPQALERLQAAAQRVQPQQAQPRAAAPAAAPVAVPQQQQAQQPQADGQRRFGLNSLIHRMTGSADAPAAKQQPQAVRQQPAMQAQAPAAQPQQAPAQQADPDQERIEIPAFLRRQANYRITQHIGKAAFGRLFTFLFQGVKRF